VGRGRKGEFGVNIEPRQHDIRLRFRWRGKSFAEPLPFKPTIPGLKAARRLARDVKIALGADPDVPFNYAGFFPDSKHAAVIKAADGDTTLAHYCELFLASCGNKPKNTRMQFKNALAFWQRKLQGDRQINQIKHSEIRAKIGEHDWPSWRLHNNYLIPLRGVFLMAAGDGLFKGGSPLAGIKNMKRVLGDDEVDPWSEEQETLILERMHNKYHEQVWNYFDYAFAEGMRPEELIELDWTRDVDLRAGTVKIQWVKSAGEVGRPKNYTIRTVEMSDRGLAILKRQAKWTRSKPHGKVFENPVTERPWADAASQRVNYWDPTLKALGLRHRVPYSTRHTCATRMLMDNCNPAWAAKQLGHTKDQFFKTYAKWIEGADKGAENAKRNARATKTANSA
jgi:integrase